MASDFKVTRQKAILHVPTWCNDVEDQVADFQRCRKLRTMLTFPYPYIVKQLDSLSTK
jgi:hypothetical protein